MEIELNGAKLRVYEDGKIERFGFKNSSKKQTWYEIKGCVHIDKNGYKRCDTKINYKSYIKSRVIYKAFNPEWNIIDISPNNTIDHIDRNSLNNYISNLRIATRIEQNINKDCVINAKGVSWHKGMNKWQSQIQINNKKIYLGYFDTEEEAITAYQNAKSTHISYII